MTFLEQRRATKLGERKAKKKSKLSQKMLDQLKIYNRQRIAYLKAHPVCWVTTCDNWASDVHHKKGRGPHLLDESTWMPVCRVCHDRIERHPVWAKAMGYSLNRLT